MVNGFKGGENMKITLRDQKKVAAQIITLAMEEIKVNIKESAIAEDVNSNSKAMKTLAEALKTISTIKE